MAKFILLENMKALDRRTLKYSRKLAIEGFKSSKRLLNLTVNCLAYMTLLCLAFFRASD